MKRLKQHLTVANAISCMALFVALSGAAYAANTLKKNQVKANNIAKEAVTAPKLKNASVLSSKLANDSVISVKLANGSVVSAKIANGAITAGKLANGAVNGAKLADGTVTTAKLGSDAVTTAKLAKDAVVTNTLGPEAVTTGKLGNEAVSGAKLSASLLGQLIRNVTYVNKESGAVSATSPQTVTAECPVGKQAIGGGARIIPGDATVVQLTESIPFLGAESKRTGWTAAAKTSEAGKTLAVEAYAVCAEL